MANTLKILEKRIKKIMSRPTPRDLEEFNSKLITIDTLSMKTKRQLYSAMRNGAVMHTLIPRVGMTLGEIAVFLVIKDKT